MSYSLPYLNKKITVKIDRPLGTKHPKHNYFYSCNYGFVPDTIAPDGKEIDAYVLGVFTPIEEFEGVCIAVIHRTNDDDDKLIIVPEGNTYSDEQIRALIEFQERFFESEIVR